MTKYQVISRADVSGTEISDEYQFVGEYPHSSDLVKIMQSLDDAGCTLVSIEVVQ